jgi:hypothetical protein
LAATEEELVKRTRLLLTGVVPAVWLGILALLLEGLFSRPSPAEEQPWHVGPVATKNFLRYTLEGLYADGAFHRTVNLANQPDDTVKPVECPRAKSG